MGRAPQKTVDRIEASKTSKRPVFPEIATISIWVAFAGSLALLTWSTFAEADSIHIGPLHIDGLTALTWSGVTFLSGLVHNYAKRYLQGHSQTSQFFGKMVGFTLSVIVFIGANHLAVFATGWLAMSFFMATLIGHIPDWAQADRAQKLALKYFTASSTCVGTALLVCWYFTGVVTLKSFSTNIDALSQPAFLTVTTCLIAAATIQSALLPFHGWLLSSMTAPTPASALMHAGFVNAGGLLLARFSVLFTTDAALMFVVVIIGAVSAIGGKLLKSVRSDVKSQLGCSTVGQMGFMIMQAGLGFFSAAITHLILHGFYKAYLFLSAGAQVEHLAPDGPHGKRENNGLGITASLIIALIGGTLFALLTGKGIHGEGGLVLTALITITTFTASQELLNRSRVPSAAQYAAGPALFVASVAVYSGVYLAVDAITVLDVETYALGSLPAQFTLVAFFVAAYLVVETRLYRRSKRLYVWLLNLSTPSCETLQTRKEDYRDYR